jgi:D-arginine dehydrogenase
MTDVDCCDVLVIGGGMAGVSIGFELAADRRVLVADMERVLAYHTTGRSAAMFLESYGGPAIRALTTASRRYLENPPDQQQLLTPLAQLCIGGAGRGPAVTELYRQVRALAPDVLLLDADQALAIQPLLRPGSVELALLEPGAMQIDVHAVHQGYVKGLRGRGGVVHRSAKAVAAARAAGVWEVADAAGGTHRAAVVVDAAGAWADEVARAAGAGAVGIRPLLRSLFLVGAPDGTDVSGLPLTADVDDAFYFRPEGAQLLCSPADETPSPPGDAKPDPLNIARALDAINEATTLGARHVRGSWAGLRSFAPDRNPVVGFDPRAEGFFWFAGQGGFGIQTAPALARLGAALLRGEEAAPELAPAGVSPTALAPGRFPSGG